LAFSIKEDKVGTGRVRDGPIQRRLERVEEQDRRKRSPSPVRSNCKYGVQSGEKSNNGGEKG